MEKTSRFLEKEQSVAMNSLDKNAQRKYEKAGGIARDALNHGVALIDEGITYLEIAEEIEAFIKKKSLPAFPVNISVNEVAAHYTPSINDNSRFKKGDVVKVDVGAHIDGYIGDTAKTIEVTTKNYGKMIKASETALKTAIDFIHEGKKLSELGSTIEKTIKSSGFAPIDNLMGHQLEQYSLHAGLSIPNVAIKTDDTLNSGNVIAIEPFVTNGTGHVKNSTHGNIYRLTTDNPSKFPRIRQTLYSMKKEFGLLPFAERWLTTIIPEKKIHLTLALLLRRGAIQQYKTLVEKKNTVVAQTEHTAIVTPNGCRVIT
jgi:methionyl aminopeptidase